MNGEAIGQLITAMPLESASHHFESHPVESAVRGISAPQEEILGSTLLGERIFLCHGWTDDRRDDQELFGASF
jgi:hypothetical protein